MRDILGHPSDVLQVAAKAALLYVTAVVGSGSRRVGPWRR
jgi:hypothetical protein